MSGAEQGLGHVKEIVVPQNLGTAGILCTNCSLSPWGISCHVHTLPCWIASGISPKFPKISVSPNWESPQNSISGFHTPVLSQPCLKLLHPHFPWGEHAKLPQKMILPPFGSALALAAAPGWMSRTLLGMLVELQPAHLQCWGCFVGFLARTIPCISFVSLKSSLFSRKCKSS